jgi:hypothetical protein
MTTGEDRGSGATGRVQQAPGLWRTDLQQHDLSRLKTPVAVQRRERPPALDA